MRSSVDIVVVGAGAAGLAATRLLADLGADVVALEAAERLGGRAWTDTVTFPGIPFDRGCHWLHSASRNPLRAAADRLGLAYDSQKSPRDDRQLYHWGRGLVPDNEKPSESPVTEAFDRIAAAGAAGEDVSAASVLRNDKATEALLRHWIGLFTSADPADLSTLDFFRYADSHEDWPVLDGYGDLVLAASGRNLPVELTTPVTAINLSGPGVTVTTPKGTIAAKAVIVTVSTSVLGAGGIRFKPALPVPLQEAIAACPLGHAEKIAFQLDHPVPGVAETTYAEVLDRSGHELPRTMVVNDAGRPCVHFGVGGHLGRDLTRAGPDAMIDFARSALVAAFGSGIRKHIVRQLTTAWGTDPLIQGAYSYARPGLADLRARLAEPVLNRLFLAGEAVSSSAFSTAHGAHETGLAAARQTLQLLRPAR